MKITLFGGTRGVGKQVLEQALAVGHDVTVLSRRETRLGGARVIVGDATDSRAVERALQGADAVICALGAPASDKTHPRSQATRAIVGAMQRLGIKRFVCLSVYGAAESRSALPFFTRRIIFPLFLKHAVADHEAQEAVVRETTLDWTLVRPPYLTDGPRTGNVKTPGVAMKISRSDAAGFMLQALDNTALARQTVAISY